MRQPALAQALERLNRARNALSGMEAADSFKVVEKHWSDFLLSAGGIYSKLEQGSKGCGKSEGWFGRKKHDRRADELLRYLHHARNSDEHGIDGTTLQMHKIKIIEGPVDGLKFAIKDGNSVVVPANKDAIVEAERFVRAKQVKDGRYGDTFMPPRSHLGKPCGDDEPRGVNVLDIARLGLAYLENLVSEAAQLPSRK